MFCSGNYRCVITNWAPFCSKTLTFRDMRVANFELQGIFTSFFSGKLSSKYRYACTEATSIASHCATRLGQLYYLLKFEDDDDFLLRECSVAQSGDRELRLELGIWAAAPRDLGITPSAHSLYVFYCTCVFVICICISLHRAIVLQENGLLRRHNFSLSSAYEAARPDLRITFPPLYFQCSRNVFVLFQKCIWNAPQVYLLHLKCASVDNFAINLMVYIKLLTDAHSCLTFALFCLLHCLRWFALHYVSSFIITSQIRSKRAHWPVHMLV